MCDGLEGIMGMRWAALGPVGHAGGGFVYTAITSGLQSEKTCTEGLQPKSSRFFAIKLELGL